VAEARRLKIPIVAVCRHRLRPRPHRSPHPGQRRRGALDQALLAAIIADAVVEGKACLRGAAKHATSVQAAEQQMIEASGGQQLAEEPVAMDPVGVIVAAEEVES